MIFKTTAGQRARITPKQRAKQGFYRTILVIIVVVLIIII